MYTHRQRALHDLLWRTLELYYAEWNATPAEVLEVWDNTGRALRAALAKMKRERKQQERPHDDE